MKWKMSDKRLFQNQSQNVYIEALSVLFYAHYMAVGIEMVLSIKKMLSYSGIYWTGLRQSVRLKYSEKLLLFVLFVYPLSSSWFWNSARDD